MAELHQQIKEATQCSCGNIFMADAEFCRKCGKTRHDDIIRNDSRDSQESRRIPDGPSRAANKENCTRRSYSNFSRRDPVVAECSDDLVDFGDDDAFNRTVTTLSMRSISPAGERRRAAQASGQGRAKERWKQLRDGLHLDSEVDDEDGDDLFGSPRKSGSLHNLTNMWNSEARQTLRKITASRYFDAFAGFVIVVNALCIGAEQSYKLAGKDTFVWDVLESCFLCFFILELVLRFLGTGFRLVKEHSIQFDLLIVGTSVFTQWILPKEAAASIGPVMVVRLIRLARLARALRAIILFRQLWVLVHGLMSSVSMMLYTLALLTIILYIFGLVGVEMITFRYLDNPDIPTQIQDIVTEYFPSLFDTMITLTQFIALDSVGTIYRPLIRFDPWLLPLFLALILVVGVVLMNLVTAVLVREAMEQTDQNKEAERLHSEKKKRKLMKNLRQLFASFDEDGSGVVSIEELLNAPQDQLTLFFEYSKSADPVAIFSHLDTDGSGFLDIDEFCEGLYQALSSQTSFELKRIDKRVDAIWIQAQKTLDILDGICNKLDLPGAGAVAPFHPKHVGHRLPHPNDMYQYEGSHAEKPLSPGLSQNVSPDSEAEDGAPQNGAKGLSPISHEECPNIFQEVNTIRSTIGTINPSTIGKIRFDQRYAPIQINDRQEFVKIHDETKSVGQNEQTPSSPALADKRPLDPSDYPSYTAITDSSNSSHRRLSDVETQAAVRTTLAVGNSDGDGHVPMKRIGMRPRSL